MRPNLSYPVLHGIARGCAFLLVLTLMVSGSRTAEAQQKPNIAGDYAGMLGPLHIKLHIKVDATGAISGTLDSTDQGAMDIPCAEFHLDGTALTFKVPAVQGSWKGTVTAEGLAGTWDQGGGPSRWISHATRLLRPRSRRRWMGSGWGQLPQAGKPCAYS